MLPFCSSASCPSLHLSSQAFFEVDLSAQSSPCRDVQPLGIAEHGSSWRTFLILTTLLLQLRLHEHCKHSLTSNSEELPEQASPRASNSSHWWCVNEIKHRCCSTAGSTVIDVVCEVESSKGDSFDRRLCRLTPDSTSSSPRRCCRSLATSAPRKATPPFEDLTVKFFSVAHTHDGGDEDISILKLSKAWHAAISLRRTKMCL